MRSMSDPNQASLLFGGQPRGHRGEYSLALELGEVVILDIEGRPEKE